MSKNPSPPTPEKPEDIEQDLRQLQPRNSLSEPDLMYRCGWEAAMAALPSRKPEKRWPSFLVGASSGIAAALILRTGWFVLAFS